MNIWNWKYFTKVQILESRSQSAFDLPRAHITHYKLDLGVCMWCRCDGLIWACPEWVKWLISAQQILDANQSIKVCYRWTEMNHSGQSVCLNSLVLNARLRSANLPFYTSLAWQSWNLLNRFWDNCDTDNGQQTKTPYHELCWHSQAELKIALG